jgi:hypothetical protein
MRQPRARIVVIFLLQLAGDAVPLAAKDFGFGRPFGAYLAEEDHISVSEPLFRHASENPFPTGAGTS